VVRA
jgi:hypothetical protein